MSLYFRPALQKCVESLLYRQGAVFQPPQQKEVMGREKFKVVIRLSWGLDYNGIEGP